MNVGGMACLPNRLANLRRSVPTLVSQLDRFHVVINGCVEEDEVPWDALSGAEVHIAGRNGGDAGKFQGLFDTSVRELSGGLYFTFDDDIEYPGDYIDTMAKWMDAVDRRGICTVHGSLFDPSAGPVGFVGRRKMYHFGRKQDEFARVLMPGTGTLCMAPDSFHLRPADFPQANMADVWVMCRAAEQRVPVYCVPRPSGWLRQMPIHGSAIERRRPISSMEAAVGHSKDALVRMHAACDSVAAEPPVRVFSHMRSGTHFLMAAIHSNFAIPRVGGDVQVRGRRWVGTQSDRAFVPWKGLFGSHSPWSRSKDATRAVCIARHPVDTLRSLWNFEGAAGEFGDWCTEQRIAYWTRHVLSFVTNRVPIIKYEDLAGRFSDTLARIRTQYGLTPRTGVYRPVKDPVGWVSGQGLPPRTGALTPRLQARFSRIVPRGLLGYEI